jgi:hypothetical protein
MAGAGDEEKIIIGEEKTTEVSIVPNGILTCRSANIGRIFDG